MFPLQSKSLNLYLNWNKRDNLIEEKKDISLKLIMVLLFSDQHW